MGGGSGTVYRGGGSMVLPPIARGSRWRTVAIVAVSMIVGALLAALVRRNIAVWLEERSEPFSRYGVLYAD
jgi:hypothetical protein